MNVSDYEEFLMRLIQQEVLRAAAAHPEYAPQRSQRSYGEALIQELPPELTRESLPGTAADALSNRLAHSGLKRRLLARWRRQHGGRRPATTGRGQ